MSRAKYIVGTAKELIAKPGGGANWLAVLRDTELPEVIESLCTLPGVGPKVAACIALFSLDKNQAIPVDTHVWKVYYMSLTIAVFLLYNRLNHACLSTILFFAHRNKIKYSFDGLVLLFSYDSSFLFVR